MIQKTTLQRIWHWHKGSIITLSICAVAICIVVGIAMSLPPDPLQIATTNHDCKGIKTYAEQHIIDREDFAQAEKALKLENCV